jgi:hypothetical protein
MVIKVLFAWVKRFASHACKKLSAMVEGGAIASEKAGRSVLYKDGKVMELGRLV